MRKGASKKLHVSTSKLNLSQKPYGFCCDLKDNPKLPLKHKVFIPPFLSSGVINDGPDIKFRINEDEAAVPRGTGRGGQRRGSRSGQRNRNLSKQRSGTLGRQYRRHSRGRNSSDRQRGGGNASENAKPGERMVCEGCRGPLRWYLEEEIAVARENMISKRKETYNTNMDKNVKIAKEKRKRKRRKNRRKQPSETKQDTNETEEKT